MQTAVAAELERIAELVVTEQSSEEGGDGLRTEVVIVEGEGDDVVGRVVQDGGDVVDNQEVVPVAGLSAQLHGTLEVVLEVEQGLVRGDEVQEGYVSDEPDVQGCTAAGNLSPRGIGVAAERLHVAQLVEHPCQVVDDNFQTAKTRAKGLRAKFPSDRELRSTSHVNVSRAEEFRIRLGFDCVRTHSSGLLWVFFNLPFVGFVTTEGDQFLSLEISHPQLSAPLTVTAVHAASTGEERRVLWDGVLHCQPHQRPWIVVGDFNVVVEPWEKRGGRPFRVAEARDFVDFMASAGLFDGGFSGSNFTWCNNRHGRARIWKRLDRVLLNEACMDLHVSVTVDHLARHPSDHAPLLMAVSTRLDSKPRCFRFINAWAAHKEFLGVVKQSWEQECEGPPLHVLCSKLQRVKRSIQAWNRDKVGNFSDNVRKAEAEVARLDQCMVGGGSENDQLQLHQAQARLSRALAMEEALWKQRSRVKWLQLGDRNTSFFHAVVKQRRMQAVIHGVQDANQEWVTEDARIGAEAIKYFSSLFSMEEAPASSEVLGVIPKLLSEDDNEQLQNMPSFEEVRDVVFAMDGDSAAGPDGFTGKFFTSSWDIIGRDVYRAVLNFFCGEELPRQVTATSIILLAKVARTKSFSEFRPISLCNFVDKILSKILAARLAPILPKIISTNQSGFVRGRLISDNYLLAQELLSNMGSKVRGGNVALKLDMMKAYDRVVWPFLINVLRAFGFGEQWIDMVWRLISNVWFSVVVNGALFGFFKSARGLRQGDPLSPALFIIGAEVLSRSLNSLPCFRGFHGFSVPRGCPLVTHLGYADDVLVFSSASAGSLKLVKRVLTNYEAVSGQRINAGKSCFLVHPKVGLSRRMAIQRLTGFMYKPFPIKYLGFPLYCGRRKKEFFGGLCQAVLLRIQSWQNRVLSQGGKIVLLKHVLSSMPIHLLMAASPPKAIFQELEGMFANFLWGASEGGPKYHWIRWQDLCVPQDAGGVGLRQLEDVYKSFSIKLWWNFRAKTSLWAQFMQAKFCRAVHPNLVFDGKGSEVWSRMVKVRNIAERHIGWIVRSGSANFWFDNWLGSGGLSDRLESVSDNKIVDFVKQATWDVRSIAQWVPSEIVAEIVRVDPPAGHLPDLMVWRPEHSGCFTIKSAFNLVRRQSSPSPLFKCIWHQGVPLRISFFLLRLLRDRLPLDGTLWKLGIHGPSRCVCCASPEVETTEYVFATGDLARQVWHFFGDSVGVAWTGLAFRVCMAAWWQGKRGNKFLKFIHLVTPLLICWHIWKARNGMKYDGQKIEGVRICHARSYMLVSWVRPSHGGLKLNTDGCSKGNPGESGGGGVLREASGRLILAFLCNFGLASSMQAEARALLFGVRLCLQRGFDSFEVELDSLVLVQVLNRTSRCPWSIYKEVYQLFGLLHHVPRVRHCYRQANQVADTLASEGCRLGREEIYLAASALPQIARGAFHLDRLGVAALRRME
nr:uncharacterized protein LOC113704429 [Coffea arabica]